MTVKKNIASIYGFLLLTSFNISDASRQTEREKRQRQRNLRRGTEIQFVTDQRMKERTLQAKSALKKADYLFVHGHGYYHPIDHETYYHNDEYYYYHPSSKSAKASKAASHNTFPSDMNPMPLLTQSVGCYSEGNCILSHNPDFSPEYQVDDTCNWFINTDSVLEVDYFFVEDGFDVVDILDGAGQITARFTGSGVDPVTGEQVDGTIVLAGETLRFISDAVTPATGFRVCLTELGSSMR
jgi:hypothetical protein